MKGGKKGIEDNRHSHLFWSSDVKRKSSGEKRTKTKLFYHIPVGTSTRVDFKGERKAPKVENGRQVRTVTVNQDQQFNTDST